MIGGRMMDISPPASRKPISGWRQATMGSQLTRDLVFSKLRAQGPHSDVSTKS